MISIRIMQFQQDHNKLSFSIAPGQIVLPCLKREIFVFFCGTEDKECLQPQVHQGCEKGNRFCIGLACNCQKICSIILILAINETGLDR